MLNPKNKKSKTVTSKSSNKKPHANSVIVGELKAEHAAFVQAYVQHFGNGTRAYMDVYGLTNPASAGVLASALLKNVKIKDAIEDEYERMFKQKDSAFKRGETYKQIEAIANAQISDVIDIDGDEVRIKPFSEMTEEAKRAIKSISIKRKPGEHGDEVTHSIVLHDKVKCLEIKAKLQNMLKDAPIEMDIVIIPAKPPTKQIDNKDIEVESKEIE